MKDIKLQIEDTLRKPIRLNKEKAMSKNNIVKLNKAKDKGKKKRLS